MQTLLQLADCAGREQDGYVRDLTHRLFPYSSMIITDRDVAGVRRCLADWILAIETALMPDSLHHAGTDANSVFPQSWATLATSGLLSDPIVLQEARMRLLLWQFAQAPNPDSRCDQIPKAPLLLGELAAMDNSLLARLGSLSEAYFPLQQERVPTLSIRS